MNARKEFGKYLREYRLDVGLSQGDVAKKLKYGSAQFVSNWERGLARPAEKDLKKIVNMFMLDRNEVKRHWVAVDIEMSNEKIRRILK